MASSVDWFTLFLGNIIIRLGYLGMGYSGLTFVGISLCWDSRHKGGTVQ